MTVADFDLIGPKARVFTPAAPLYGALSAGFSPAAPKSALLAAEVQTPLPTPAAPFLTVSGSYGIMVNWATVSNASGYTIEWTNNGGGNGSLLVENPTHTARVLNDLPTGFTYTVRVQANGTGDYADSEFSDSANIYLPAVFNVNDFSKLRNANLVDANGNPFNAGVTVTWSSTPEKRVTYIGIAETGHGGLLDLSGCAALTQLWCYNNQLTTLNVSGCTALTSLHCYVNQLTSLNVSGCTALEDLQCHRNQLATLNVSGCTALTMLSCGDNQLTTLDVSGYTALKYLYCQTNQLTTLNVSGCSALADLDCQYNDLTTLNVSGCTALTGLLCSNNRILPSALGLPSGYNKTLWFDNQSNIPGSATGGVTIDFSAETTAHSDLNIHVTGWAWTVGGVPISGATSFYTPTAADLGKTLQCVMTAANDSTYTFTATVPQPTELSAATLGTVTAGGGSTISVAWKSVPNAAGYTIQWASDPAFTTGLGSKTAGPSDTKTTLDSLKGNAKYYVRVLAKGDGLATSDSAWSAVKSATTLINIARLSSPAISTVTASGSDTIDLTWSDVSGAAAYEIQYSTSSSFSTYASTGMISGTSVTIEKLAANTTYYFRVMAKASAPNCRDSAWSTIKKTTTLTKAPTHFSGSPTTADSVTLTWDAQPGLSGYVLRYKASGDSEWQTSTPAPAANATKATITGLTADTRYDFILQAVNAGGPSDGAVVSVTLDAARAEQPWTPPLKPTVAADASGNVDLAWNAVRGASGYTVWRKVGTGGYTLIGGILAADAFVYTDTTAPTGAVTYAVRAVKGLSYSPYTPVTVTVEATPVLKAKQSSPAPATDAAQSFNTPLKPTSTVSGTSLVLNWNPVLTATGYTIWKLNDNGVSWTRLNAAAVTGTSYTLTNAASGTYAVRAVKGMSYSPYQPITVLMPASGGLFADLFE